MLCSSASCSTWKDLKTRARWATILVFVPVKAAAERGGAPGADHQAWQPAIAAADGGDGVADRALAAALRRLAALGTSALGREQRRRTQKSDRKRSAAAGDRSMAHRHWAQTTRRARAAAQQRSLNRKEGNLI